MKLKQKTLRLALIVAVTAGVYMPVLTQPGNRSAAADAPAATAPAQPKAVPFPKVDPDTVVIRVGDQTVTAGEIYAILERFDQPTREQILANAVSKRALGEQYVRLKLLAGEARRIKLDQSPLVKTQIEQLLGNAVAEALVNDKTASENFFKDNKVWFEGLKVRHILITFLGSGIEGAKLTEAQALAKAVEIRERLIKGAKDDDFASIARRESDDRVSAAIGGDLGLVTRYRMVPAFEDAAYALKDKEISQPIKSPFGYHIIEVMGRTVMNFEEVIQQVDRRRLDLLIEGLKKSKKPVIDDSFFGPADAKPAPATTDAPAPRP